MKTYKLDDYSGFSSIREKVLDWNLETLNGTGYSRNGHENFAFFEVKIIKSDTKESNMLWKVNPELFPSKLFEESEKYILRSSNLFLNYIKIIKGENINLNIEIINALYSPVDRFYRASFQAMNKALINCFDNELSESLKLKFYQNINYVELKKSVKEENEHEKRYKEERIIKLKREREIIRQYYEIN
ncbi:hypothetical protein [uncultured Tenacibaculum sp.]|uniref:hypothetical protein n=1 Tax=uncultured Tenacibaculum sp. TaxID=174713 RepID=UPI00261D987F|nr:hypothetical protein [uncultured Tenacibaculum sp.]